jgi:hypothetical protein
MASVSIIFVPLTGLTRIFTFGKLRGVFTGNLSL